MAQQNAIRITPRGRMVAELVKECVKIIAWLLVLLLLPALLLGIFANVFIDVGPVLSSESFSSKEIVVALIVALLTPLIALPILYKISVKENQKSSLQTCFQYWCLKNVSGKSALKYALISGVYWLMTGSLAYYLEIPLEPFMNDFADAISNPPVLLLSLLVVAIVVPIMEEIIFRGWLFTRVANTKLGNIGALLFTSIAFSVAHSQYTSGITFVSLFFLGLLFGYIRYKTNNIGYCFFAHCTYNTLGILASVSIDSI